jgi:hypothetical protein
MPKFKALARMREAVGKYDPKVLEAVAVGFDVYLADQAAPDATAGVSIAFKDLQVGAVLKADLLTSEGTLIVAAGTEISAMLLEKLRNFAQLSGIKEPILIEKE